MACPGYPTHDALIQSSKWSLCSVLSSFSALYFVAGSEPLFETDCKPRKPLAFTPLLDYFIYSQSSVSCNTLPVFSFILHPQYNGHFNSLFYMAQTLKNLPAMQETRVLIPGLERSPREGNGNPLQYSCLENPTDRGAWQASVLGVLKSWRRPSDFHFQAIERVVHQLFFQNSVSPYLVFTEGSFQLSSVPC